MKRIVILLLALLGLISRTGVANENICLSNGEWAPYLSKKLPHYGAASHIVEKAFAAVGITVEYQFFPWKRSYRNALDGVCNGTLVWVYTPERARNFYYSDVVITDVEYLFHLKDTPLQWKSVDDLQGLTIGATLHTVYPTLEEAAEGNILRIERGGNYDNLYRRLLKKRIDAVPQVAEVGKYYLRTSLTVAEQAQVTYSDTILQTRKYHLILSKKVDANIRYLELFNQGLKTIRANGTYKGIIGALQRGEYDRKVE